MAKGLLSAIVLSSMATMQLTAAEPASRFATLDGNKIHYLSYGTGSVAAVFIHGWTCDATFWKGQAPVYEKRRSLLVDLPGHGLSDKPDIPYTMTLFAEAVNAAMKDAKVDKAILIGHSMGTPVAVQFLRMHPEKVAGLVIVDGFIPQPPEDAAAKLKQKAQADGLTKAYRGPEYKKMAGRMLAGMFTKQTDPAMRKDIEAKMLAAPQYVMASAMEGMMAMEPLTENYPDLPVEAMMVKRAGNAQFPDFLKQHFKLVRYEVFEDAGHFLMMEEPARFNGLLVEFLSGLIDR